MAVNSHTEPEQSNLTLNLSPKEERLPFVFQCKGCNNIIGDSSAFTSSDQELEVICLNGKCRKCVHQRSMFAMYLACTHFINIDISLCRCFYRFILAYFIRKLILNLQNPLPKEPLGFTFFLERS